MVEEEWVEALAVARVAAAREADKAVDWVERAEKAGLVAAMAVRVGAGLVEGKAAEAVALAELRRVEAVCRDATRAHLLRVAAVMEAAQGERFIGLVLPKLGDQKHDAPCELK